MSGRLKLFVEYSAPLGAAQRAFQKNGSSQSENGPLSQMKMRLEEKTIYRLTFSFQF